MLALSADVEPTERGKEREREEGGGGKKKEFEQYSTCV